MKHFYTVVAASAISLCAFAGNYRSAEVSLLDGTSVKINLADDLSATFAEDCLVVTGGEKDIKVACKDIKSFTFSTEAVSGVDAVGADVAAPVVDGSVLTFNNLPEGSVVAVYNAAGVQLLHEVVSGSYSLDLSDFTAQVVIVKVNNVAFKFATK